MRIERISDKQIRCILSKRDLSERQLKISELAYGSERAKELFRDMMEQANSDFGFDTDDIPLMIEAIPTSKESIILVITKVEDPDEFEEKFSQFGNIANRFEEYDDEDEEFYDEDLEDEPDEYADDLINCFEQLNEIIAEADDNGSDFIPLHELLKKRRRGREMSEKHSRTSGDSTSRLYSFPSLNFIVSASKAVVRVYSGKNSVWKDEETSIYYMILSKNNKMASFDKVCTILGEFGKKETLTYATQDFFNEHYKLILKDDAISQLSML